MYTVIVVAVLLFLFGGSWAYTAAHAFLGFDKRATGLIRPLAPWGTRAAVLGAALGAVSGVGWPSRLLCLAAALLLAAALFHPIRSWRRQLLMTVGYLAGAVGVLLTFGPIIAAAQ